jgi:hypothetical protein
VVLAIVNGDGDGPLLLGPPVAGCRRSGDGGTKPTRATADEIRFWREILPVTAYSPFVTVGIDTNSVQMACLSPPLARQLLRPARASPVIHLHHTFRPNKPSNHGTER